MKANLSGLDSNPANDGLEARLHTIVSKEKCSKEGPEVW